MMKRKAIHRQVNKYLRQPIATLDLHGCSRREAEEELIHFFNYWLKQGGGVKLLIITGQGWHSPDGQDCSTGTGADSKKFCDSRTPGLDTHCQV